METMFGADPEFFVVNENNICIPPAVLRVKYNLPTFGVSDPGPENDERFNRHPLFYKDEEVSIIEDGAALELNLKPATCAEELYTRADKGFRAAEALVKPLGFNILKSPAVPFDNNVINIKGSIDPYLQWCTRFGCDKDIDAYSGTFSSNIDASNIKERYAGGHLHISGVSQELAVPFIRLLDILIGNTCIALTTQPDKEHKRQEHYGRPGKYRLPIYEDGTEGIEYRTPSVLWITELTNTFRILNMAYKAVKIIEDVDKVSNIFIKYADKAINNILSCNIADAGNLYEEVKKELA